MDPGPATRRIVSAACVALLLAACPARAEPGAHQDISCTTRGHLFDTELAAALALGSCYGARSAAEDREYMAAILRLDAGYRIVVTPGEPRHGRVTLRFPRYRGETLAALWHTHGTGGSHRHLFSPEDTALATAVGVPFYLSDPQGRLRVFRPGDRARLRWDRTTVRPPFGSAPGTLARLPATTSPENTRAISGADTLQ
jgi:hypothetical protein